MDRECHKTIYCMNLESRTDRWNETVEEVKKLGDTYRLNKVSAIENKRNPQLGHAQTFMGIIKMAKTENLEAVLIGEDDLVLYPESKERWEFAYDDLPDDWDVFSGGAYYLRNKQVISPYLCSLTDFCATHFIMIRNTAYDKILTHENNNLGSKNIDRFIGKLVTKGELKYYVTWPMISSQRAGYSDLRKKNVDDNKNNERRGLIFLTNNLDKIDNSSVNA